MKCCDVVSPHKKTDLILRDARARAITTARNERNLDEVAHAGRKIAPGRAVSAHARACTRTHDAHVGFSCRGCSGLAAVDSGRRSRSLRFPPFHSVPFRRQTFSIKTPRLAAQTAAIMIIMLIPTMRESAGSGRAGEREDGDSGDRRDTTNLEGALNSTPPHVCLSAAVNYSGPRTVPPSPISPI
jgi:hypothetical protein